MGTSSIRFGTLRDDTAGSSRGFATLHDQLAWSDQWKSIKVNVRPGDEGRMFSIAHNFGAKQYLRPDGSDTFGEFQAVLHGRTEGGTGSVDVAVYARPAGNTGIPYSPANKLVAVGTWTASETEKEQTARFDLVKRFGVDGARNVLLVMGIRATVVTSPFTVKFKRLAYTVN